MKTFGKALMTLAIAIYTFIPPMADLLTETHVFHEGWMPHARMHTVWLLGLTSGVGLLALYLLWNRGFDTRLGVNLAAALSAIVYAAFFLSAATTPLYAGALSDVKGGIAKGPFEVDANLFTFTVACLILVSGWVTCALRND